jgi:hypothetical protein
VKRLLPLLAAAALGCSNITDVGNGIVALEVKVPARLEVEVGDTLQLSARALDRNGDSVPAEITWTTPDTTLGVVPATGQILGLAPGSGRVQATQGTLISEFLTFTVLGRADSLALPDAGTVVVAPAGASSPPLPAQLVGPAGVSLAGHRLIYTVIDPPLADAAVPSLAFPNGGFADTVATAGDGTPVSPITLNRVAGVAPPPSATVQVRALRPSGAAIAGSGQTIAVSFQ